MASPALAPTVTHRVRAFLQEQGIDLKPWSGLDETYAKLYSLMRRRRGDPSFWEPLSGLLRLIVADATDERAGRLPAPQAELLRAWDVEALLGDLRAAISEGEGASAAARFGARLPAAVLGLFLLLGLVAAGCSASTRVDGGADGAVDADVVVDADAERPGWAEGCDLPSSSALFQTLLESELGESTNGLLCQCFASLNTSWNDGLAALFSTGTAEQVAAALQEMIECCQWEPSAFGRDFDEARGLLLTGELCYVALPYRGVAFPQRW